VKKFILGLIVGLLLPVIGGYLYLKMGMMPVAANGATPMPMEEKIANMALEARISKEAPKTAPVAADEANMTEGAHVYVQHCAFCHGFSGEKASFAAKGMFPLPPQLLSEHMVNDDPVGETYWKVSHGIRLTGMPGFNEMLTPTQMWQVSQLLAHADKLPDQTKAALAKPPAVATAPAPAPAPAQPPKTKKK
jgi:thiosulfate dehydrogenase